LVAYITQQFAVLASLPDVNATLYPEFLRINVLCKYFFLKLKVCYAEVLGS
jgi:hypothetical protein